MKRQGPVIIIETSSEEVINNNKEPNKKFKREISISPQVEELQQKSINKNRQGRSGKKTPPKSQNLFRIQKGLEVQQEKYDSTLKQNKQDKNQNQNDGKTQESLIIKFQKTKQVPNQKNSRNRITPWFTKSSKQIEDSLLRFHNQIVEFYNYIKPSQKQHQYKLSVLEVVKYLINQKFPEAEVLPFGSFVTKLYLPDGDIDVAIKIKEPIDGIRGVYDQIHRIIKKQEGIIFTQIQYIRKAKVPLIKFIHIQSQIQFDVSVNKLDGVQQIKFVKKMDAIYPQFKYLVFVFKCMLRIRQMQQTYTGGIGSFLLFCMILHYLRSYHKKQKYLTLAQHVLKFMDFYGINTDWQKKSIYVQTGDQVARARQPGTLSFFSPQDDSHDIGKSAYKIRDVFNVFKNRYRVIMGTNYKQKQSILKDLVNPSNELFKYYRYEKKFKPDNENE